VFNSFQKNAGDHLYLIWNDEAIRGKHDNHFWWVAWAFKNFIERRKDFSIDTDNI